MNVRTDKNGQIIKPNEPPAQTQGQGQAQPKEPLPLYKILGKDWVKKEIARALPRHLDPDRILRIGITALRNTRDLHLCDAPSFLACMFQTSQLGLEPNTPLGHAYLIPRRNKKREEAERRAPIFECTLIIGYQGMLELSTRSDRVTEVMAMAVRDGDHFKRKMGLNPVLEHEFSDDPDREMKPITHVWAIARLKNGGQPWISLSRTQIDARRARSAASQNGPWVTDYEAMAQKTAIRALWKFLPKNAEMAIAEQLEVADEINRPQRNAFAAEVHDALERNGLQPLEPEEPLPVPDAKDEPGEPAPPAPSAP
jgi:recombination protein RecT